MHRFQPSSFENNVKLVGDHETLAEKDVHFGAASSCLGHQSVIPTVIPIPDARTVDRVTENERADNVKLSREEMVEIDQLLTTYEMTDDRYYPDDMKHLNSQESPTLPEDRGASKIIQYYGL